MAKNNPTSPARIRDAGETIAACVAAVNEQLREAGKGGVCDGVAFFPLLDDNGRFEIRVDFETYQDFYTDKSLTAAYEAALYGVRGETPPPF